ncbi:MAG: proline--tRNA ligase [Alphaproteobacteria bacterium]
MKLSTYFLPTLKETPAEAQIVSHRLMLRAGLICQETSGIYSWLPLGLRVLKKIEQIVREEQDKAGCQEILMPILQTADLWQESGRYDDYGQEMLRVQDRHKRNLLFGPTAEEVVTDIFRRHVKSYKDLPKCLYQIQWKFRDEIRPRFGVMRGREFFMKDAYSFDIDKEGALETYRQMMLTYLKTFQRMGLAVVPVKADTGAIGGDLSHEFHVLAQTGESAVYYDKKFDEMRQNIDTIDVNKIMKMYAMADDLHKPAECPLAEKDLCQARGIEVGHIFNFGTKYSAAMKAQVMGPDGGMVLPEMGSYGIGVSRLVGALIEANHDDKGIIWPEAVSPFDLGLLNLRASDPATTAMCDHLYEQLTKKGISVLYDDRDEGAGIKFSTMDLIGLPRQILVGPKGLKDNLVELKNRRTGAIEHLSPESLVEGM